MVSEIKLDFRLAKFDDADKVLRAIAKEALEFLFQKVNVNKIKCILLTGSVANGEGTMIKHNSSIITSDFDFVVYLDFPCYLKYNNYFQNLSREISRTFKNKGFDTHIEFLPSNWILQKIIAKLTNQGIYEYEFAFASRCIFGERLFSNKIVRPSKRDALELAFTVVSDLVFSNLKNLSKFKESYIYAKRALTLLNSILIFHGYFAKTYEQRIKIAKDCASSKIIPINEDEIKVLQLYTEYKLSGSLDKILNSMGYDNIADLIQFQKRFLRNLTAKIVYHELNNIFIKTEKIEFEEINFLQSSKFHKLLMGYFQLSEARLLSRILGITLYVAWSFTRNRTRKELFATFLFHKQPPKVILNVLTLLLLIYGNDLFENQFLEKIFPWMRLDTEIEPLQSLFFVWHTAEQSIKL